MSRPPLEVADLIRTAGAAFIERNRHRLSWKQCPRRRGYRAGAGRPCRRATRIPTPRRSVRRGTTTQCPANQSIASVSCSGMLSSLGVPAALKAEGKPKAGSDLDSGPTTHVGQIT
jgi:hypothetical protein